MENTEELIDALINQDPDLSRVRQFKQLFFDEIDGKASKRVVQEIFIS